MTAVLGDQQSLALVGGNHQFLSCAGVIALVGEVVVGIEIFQQAAFQDAADTGGGTDGIQFMSNGICGR
jgi:hypothetical protein